MAQKQKTQKHKSKSKPITSSFATGGGGFSFENHVGAVGLTHLLTGTSFRDTNNLEIDEIRWQRKEIDDVPLDDLVIVLKAAHAPQQKALFSLQLKHDLAWGISDNNVTFKAVMKACWETFCQGTSVDSFGVGVGTEKADYTAYRRVIARARDCCRSEDFINVIEKGTGAKEKAFLGLMRVAINANLSHETPPRVVSNEELWQFLRRFRLLHFDLLVVGSRDLNDCHNLLKSNLRLNSSNVARDLWNELLALTTSSNTNAGSCDLALLHEKVVRFLPSRVSDEGQTVSADNVSLTKESITNLLSSFGFRQSEVSTIPLTQVDDSSLTPRTREEERADGKIEAARDLIQQGQAIAARQILESLLSNELSPRLQYRIKANLGSCASLLGEDQKAGELYRAAYQHDPNNPKALVIGAQGELFAGQPKAAALLCERALAAEPQSSDAALIYIQALQGDKRPGELKKWLAQNSWVNDDAQCATPLSRFDWDQGHRNKAIQRLDKVHSMEAPSDDMTSMLGFYLLTRACDAWKKQLPFNWRLPAPIQRDLKRSADLYGSLLAAYPNTDSRKQQKHWLGNRAVALMLLNQDEEARQAFERAKNMAPNDPIVWMNTGWLESKSHNDEAAVVAHEKARELLDSQGLKVPSEFDETSTRWENARGLAVAYQNTDRWEKLRVHLDSVLRWNGTEFVDEAGAPLNGTQMTYDVCNFIEMWIMSRDEAVVQAHGPLAPVQNGFSPEQRAAMEWLKIAFPNHAEVVSLRADIAWFKKQFSVAVKLMRSALSLASEHQKDRFTLILAQSLFNLGKYAEAAGLFKGVVQESAPNTHLRNYVLALSRSNQAAEAMRIARQVRQQGRKAGEKEGHAIPVFSEVEANCADFIGDFKTAIRLRRQLVSLEPERTDHVLALALLENRAGDLSKAQQTLCDLWLSSPESNPELAMDIARAKAQLGIPGALDLAYTVWRAFPNDARLQSTYMGIFHEVNAENDALYTPQEVGLDCAVTYKILGAKEQTRTKILVEGNTAALLKDNEIRIDTPLGKVFWGKSVGETVLLSQTPTQKNEAEIVAIRHKFLYAFQETIERLRTGEISSGSFWVGDIEKEGGAEKWLENQRHMLLERRRSNEAIADIYRENPIPLSCVGLAKNRFCFELWEDIGSIGGRFYASNATPEQVVCDIAVLTKEKALVLDVTALGCISLLGWEAPLKRRFPRLLVPVAVREELALQLQNLTHWPVAKGYLAHDGNRLVYVEADPEEAAKKLKRLQRLLEFVDKKCEVLPVPMLLAHQTLVARLGKGAMAAILLAKENNIALWNDDWRWREFGRSQFGIRSTYFFPLMWHILTHRERDMSEGLYRLVGHGYSAVWFPIDLMLLCLEKRRWETTQEIRTLFWRLFNGQDIKENYAAQQVAGLIHALWYHRPRLLESQFRLLLEAALEGYVFCRSSETALHLLKNQMKPLFVFDALAQRLLFADIDNWQRRQLRVIDIGALFKPATHEEAEIVLA